MTPSTDPDVRYCRIQLWVASPSTYDSFIHTPRRFIGSVGILVEKAKGVIIERIQPKTRTRWQASKGR
jgi:hypothetical protein